MGPMRENLKEEPTQKETIVTPDKETRCPLSLKTTR